MTEQVLRQGLKYYGSELSTSLIFTTTMSAVHAEKLVLKGSVASSGQMHMQYVPGFKGCIVIICYKE